MLARIVDKSFRKGKNVGYSKRPRLVNQKGSSMVISKIGLFAILGWKPVFNGSLESSCIVQNMVGQHGNPVASGPLCAIWNWILKSQGLRTVLAATQVCDHPTAVRPLPPLGNVSYLHFHLRSNRRLNCQVCIQPVNFRLCK